MSITGFNHYNLCADRALIDELRQFYVSVVGLVPGERPPFNSFGYWLYAGNQAVLHLSESSPKEERLRNVVSTLSHVAFTCNDMQAATNRLRQYCVPYTHDAIPLTGELQLFFCDPAGNGVELNFPANTTHMGDTALAIEDVVCVAVVPIPPSQAFDLFTRRLVAWWPRDYTFSKNLLTGIYFGSTVGD